MEEIFRKISRKTANLVGSPYCFSIAVITILIWALLGPYFHFSDTWQLVINTGTTIITFLMVFLIQNSQNRDSKAINLKLDELLRVTKEARSSIIDIEDSTEEQIRDLIKEFQRLHSSKS